MAIGMGRMLGLHYLENFDYPYMSKTVTEFWRRWHISLGGNIVVWGEIFAIESKETRDKSRKIYSIDITDYTAEYFISYFSVISFAKLPSPVPSIMATQLFSSFVVPLSQNNLEIEVSFKAKSTSSKPLDESAQIYKVVKESAQQLGLKLEVRKMGIAARLF